MITTVKRALRNLLWSATGLFLAALVLFAVWILYPLANSVSYIKTTHKVVALTFDDGPYPVFTEQILDVLAEHGVKATFFVTGSYLQQHPELARRAVAEGHELANHGWDGSLLALQSSADIEKALAETDRLIAAAGGPANPHFRPGRAALGLLGKAVVEQRPGHMILGDTGAVDWVRPGWENVNCPIPITALCPTQDGQAIYMDLKNSVRAGSIVVLHDGYDAGPGAYRGGTVEAVSLFVPALLEKHFRFLTVSELLAHPDAARSLD